MKCNKVKNPCKICFQPVSKKNGLQCQGACQKWAHFNCLNYTPGKIQDIKAGVIKITCPCPDCNTAGPKEVLTDPPYTCTNIRCPANKLPVCDSFDCAANPIPTYPPFESSQVPKSPCSPPKTPPCVPPKTPPCVPPRKPPACHSPPKCPSPKPKPPCVPSPPTSNRNGSSPCPPVCPQTCPSYQKMKSFSPKQSLSCSDISNESSSSGRQSGKMRTVFSDSKVHSAGVDPKTLFCAVESLCNTVGQLSNQLKSLLCKIQAGYGK